MIEQVALALIEAGVIGLSAFGVLWLVFLVLMLVLVTDRTRL
jgi:hypothetical protein